jgi:GTP pyrophosphokinase
VSCNTVTGSDRISKMRFDFELGDPSHLESVVGGIKQIDGIYDAYRVLPGKGDAPQKQAVRELSDEPGQPAPVRL